MVNRKAKPDQPSLLFGEKEHDFKQQPLLWSRKDH